MNYRWILFDLDNTLFDFDTASKFALQTTFEAFEVPHTLENVNTYQAINHQCWTDFENGKMDFKTIRDIRFERFSKAIRMDLNATKMADKYLHQLSLAETKIEGATEILDHLKPNYNLVVVTNGLQEVKRPQLSRPEIAHYFKAIIISEEIGVAKPHAGFFEHTTRTIGSPPKSEMIIIGDSINSDIRGGQDFGIDTCWFNPKEKVNNTNVAPTFEIQKLHDLLNII